MPSTNRNHPTLLLLGVAVVLTGCANRQNSYADNSGIIIDTQGVNMQQYQYDLQDCKQYAEQVPVGERAVKSSAGGAVMGGVIGAVIGNSDTAAKGAGVGAVTGAAKGARSGYREKQQVVRNCLRGRGYKVLN